MTTYEPLKNQFGADVPVKIAAMICAVYPKFAHKKFTHDALNGYEALDLTPRARHISNALAVHLPADREKALHILIASLGPKLDTTNSFGMTSFIYLPHVFFVAEHGLAHFDVSMRAQYEITQRFTAEFSLRAFVEHDLHKTLTYLDAWIKDPSPHVRRLVSEGTRPRLPWAARLRVLQRDPSPMLPLLERLRDDPDLYVRRSVANHLNDIGKDHPALLLQIARDWLKNPPKQHAESRRWLITHALRSAVKRADPAALDILGFGAAPKISIQNIQIAPARLHIGSSVKVAFEVVNTSTKAQQILADCRVHFMKANGKTSPKVFKLKTSELAPSASVRFQRTISLANLTTRKPYPGSHTVEAIINGITYPLGEFEVLA